MDILLLNSPIYDKKIEEKEDYLPPLGLGYIATELEKNNISVSIVDCVLNNYTVFEIETIIHEKSPEFVGINIFSINFDIVKEIIEECNDKVTFIVGGKSTKFLYKEILSFHTSNEIIVTIGEGEFITVDIVKKTVKEKPFFKKSDNRIVYCVDDNSDYFPRDISKLNLNRKFFSEKRKNVYGEIEENIITSRECIYNCAFCGAARSLNSSISVRERSPESIIRELRYIENRYPDVRSIRVLDDLFLKNRSSIEKAIHIFNSFCYSWRAMAHIQSFAHSYDLLQKMKESGCKELEIGIESGSDKIRKYIHKIGSSESVYDIICKILDEGINVKGYFIFGFPSEKYEECFDTYKLAERIYEYSLVHAGNFRASAFQFRPYHGTELYLEINKDLKYSRNEKLNCIANRSQFNFTAGNFSKCNDDDLNDFIIRTNALGNVR